VSHHVAADERLETMAAELEQHGLDVNGPCDDQLPPDGPGTSYIGVRNPATGQYAEVTLVSHTPDPAAWFLQLSFWTDSGHDPDGRHMAGRVTRLLCGHAGAHPAASRLACASPAGAAGGVAEPDQRRNTEPA